MKAVNLIPGDERNGPGITAGRSGGGVLVIFGLLAALAVFALLYGLAAHKITSRRAEVVSLAARAQQAQAHAGQLAPYTSFLQMREQRAQAVSALVDSRFDWAHAFHELGRVLPPNKVSLASLDGTIGSTSSASAPATPSGSGATAASGSSPVASATPPGSVPTFALAGCAISQAEVALMLDRLRLIDGVSEVTLQSSSASGSSGGGGSGGSCTGHDLAFTAQVVFDALPSVPASSSSSAGASRTVATPAGGASTRAASAGGASTSGTASSGSPASKAPAGTTSTSSAEAVR